jgi:peptidoglycan/LPS O-acetylase OafA/YrhL
MAAVTEPQSPGGPVRTRTHFPHFPALDGLRGVAVLAIVAFGLGSKWAKGGHLGSDTLFALMGFLAMASLLSWRADGRGVRLRDFWTRRVRRIVVPMLVGLGLALAFGFAAANAQQRHRLPLDGLSAILSLANWRMLQTHQGVGPANGLASPVRQFWLLAVVGQVVLVVSLLTMLLLDKLRWTRNQLAGLLAVLAAISTVLCAVLYHSPARVLYGTDTRAAELLVGCLLALIIYDPRVTIRLAMPGPVRDTINGVGVAAGLFLLVAWVTFGTNKTLVLVLGLPAVAIASVAVILACIVPEGPVASLLALPPARFLGRIAIALYLVYWPIFVWIAPGHVRHLHGLKLMAVRLVAAFVAAVVLQFLYERARDFERRAKNPRQLVAVASVAVVLVAGGFVAVGKSGPKDHGVTVQAAGTTSTTTAAAPPPKVAFYGDALASTLEAAAKSWAAQTGKIQVVEGDASPTCGIDRDQVIRNAAGASVPLPSECSTWDSQWASSVASQKPDIAVVVTGISEVADHRNPSDPNFTGIGDAGYQYQLYLLMHKAVDALAASGTKVIWLNLPNFAPNSGPPSDSAKVAAFNTLLTTLGQKDHAVTIEDVNAWIKANGGPGAAPSAAGWGPAAADHVVTDFLAGRIASLWAAERGSTTTTTGTATTAGASGTTVTVLPPPAGVDLSGTTGHTGTGGGRKTKGGHTTTSDGTTRTTRVPGSPRTTQGG